MNSDKSNPADGPRKVPRVAYEACPPGLLPAAQISFVETIHQRFLTALSQVLIPYLDTAVIASPAAIEQKSLGELREEAGNDACVMTLDLAPVPGRAWIGFPAKLIFHVLDILLGAAPAAPAPMDETQSAPAERPPVTEIELHILQEFLELVVHSLDEAWSGAGIRLILSSAGPGKEQMQNADADGAALVLNSVLKLGEIEESFRVALPVLAVRLVALRAEQAEAGQSASEAPVRAGLLEAVGTANIRLEAVMGGSTLRMSDLAAIEPGQVLMLSQPAGSPFECLVNGKLKYRGEWVTHGDRQALQIESKAETAG